MEHPLINDADSLSLDDLQTKITELSKKLGIAHRSGNAHLRAQVQMALDTYRNKFQEKQQALWDQQKKTGPDWSDRIDIS